MGQNQQESVVSTVAEGVCTILLQRPDVFNAFDEQMTRALLDALRKSEKDPLVRCIVLRGAGDKAFCTGLDLKHFSTAKRSLKEILEKGFHPIVIKIRTMPKPVIAMINGVAAGAGSSLAFACDMRFMSSTAKLIQVFIRIGLVPDSGSHWFLLRSVGSARAFEYAATGRDIPAAEAERVGLVNAIIPPERLESETMAVARKLALAPTAAIGLMKRGFNKAATTDLESMLAYEAYLQQIASESEDHEEGVKAFLEKRSPRFSGK